ncbi:MAG: hypothetical protein A2007_00485 [Verrucomicrobia bacterium GWC2_42_7]|nr:MAG: hypothetical protein A2007_00485 [Verrucomicrobia bacterium GWC2_42_7]
MILLVTSLPALADDIFIETYFSPEVVPVGDIAYYCIEIIGTRIHGTINIPKVKGLKIVSCKPVSSTENINGVRKIREILKFSIVPSKEGEFTIPAFAVKIRDQEYQIPSASVTVKKAAPNKLLRLDFFSDRQKFFVGEVIPVHLVLKCGKQIEIRENTRIECNAISSFSKLKLGNPHQSEIKVDGTSVTQVEWQGSLTCLKTGNDSLSFSMNLLTTTIDPSGQDEDQFLPFFGGSPSTREVALNTEEMTCEILPFPTAGKPTTFKGAIGQFTLKQPILSEKEVKEGDPVAVSFSFEGKGNFERIQAINLSDEDNWKIYPPKRTFKAKDESEFEGELTFEYVLIPQNKGNLLLPQASFNFFDPHQEKYIELAFAKTDPILVKAGEKVPMPTLQPVAKKSEINENALVPIKLRLETLHPRTGSIVHSYLFWWIQGALFTVLLCLAFWNRRRQKYLSNKKFAHSIIVKKILKKEWNKLLEAKKKDHYEQFYSSTQSIIQTLTSRLWLQVNSAATLEEVRDFLKTQLVDDETIMNLEAIIASNDLLKFARNQLTKDQIETDFKRLELVVASLQKKL